MINPSVTEGSAKIYQFPAGGRSALAGRRHGESIAVTEFAESAVNLVDCSGSWYHASAILESKPGTTRERWTNEASIRFKHATEATGNFV
jgi:hypothetical protein